jgi:hypothetical protein
MIEDTSKGAVLTHGFEPDQLFKNGFTLKSVDLIQGGIFREVIGRTVILLMSACQGQEGETHVLWRHGHPAAGWSVEG